MPETETETPLEQLIRIMALLRSEEGCQWDRQQTPESLKKHILEEAYELLEAIDQGEPTEICDELGDLLLQVVFQAQIFTERKQFDIQQVAHSICQKLIRRHPHIFADADFEGHEERWEQIKLQERTASGKGNSLTQRIPASLPALKRATKLIRKTEQTDFSGSLKQLHLQLQQLDRTDQADTCRLQQQLAELLLQSCRLVSACNLDPEDLLRQKTTQLIAQIDTEMDNKSTPLD